MARSRAFYSEVLGGHLAILAVDDNAVNREVLREALFSLGVEADFRPARKAHPALWHHAFYTGAITANGSQQTGRPRDGGSAGGSCPPHDPLERVGDVDVPLLVKGQAIQTRRAGDSSEDRRIAVGRVHLEHLGLAEIEHQQGACLRVETQSEKRTARSGDA